MTHKTLGILLLSSLITTAVGTAINFMEIAMLGSVSWFILTLYTSYRLVKTPPDLPKNTTNS